MPCTHGINNTYLKYDKSVQNKCNKILLILIYYLLLSRHTHGGSDCVIFFVAMGNVIYGRH